mgnify:CR=1 FL=1
MIGSKSTKSIESLRESFREKFFSKSSTSTISESEREDPLTSHIFSPACLPMAEFTRKFRLLETIGEGSSAVVHRCEEIGSGKIWAAKITRPRNEEVCDALRKEVSGMKRLSHQNVIHFEEVFADDSQNVYLSLMEFALGEDLLHHINRKRFLQSREAKTVFFRILQGLRYLHSHSVVHRDLKAANIRVSKDLSLVKIIDFNVARIGTRRRSFETQVQDLLMGSLTGSPDIRAPEMLSRKLYGKEVDMWAAGCLLVQILTGTKAFDSKAEHADQSMIDQSLAERLQEHFRLHKEKVSEEAADLIGRLLTVDPCQRMTAEQALNHPWLRKERKMSSEIEVKKPVLLSLEDLPE